MEETKEKKSLWNKKTVSLAALVTLMLAFGATWAIYNSVQSLENPLGTSHSGAAIIEEFNPDSSFLPGETVPKKVKFANTGKMDLFLRVEVPHQEGWYKDGEPVEDLDVDMVIKNWTDAWKEDGSGDWTEIFTDPETGKQYRYYKHILPAGESTKEILESIKLSTEVSNDRHNLDYSDKVYKLTFNAEAVPVEERSGNLSVQAEWKMSVTETDGTLTWSRSSDRPRTGN